MDYDYSDKVKRLVRDNNYIATTHFYNQRRDRDLKYINVPEALKSGEVIERTICYGGEEHYVIYCEQKEKTFHITLAYANGTLLLTTIYKPDSTSYKEDNKTRVDYKDRKKR